MKVRFLSVFLFLCLVFPGCFLKENSSTSILGLGPKPLKSPLSAQVKLVIKPSAELAAALRAQTGASVVFELKLINYGNVVDPFILLRKKADIVNNQATVTFDSVPVVSTVASLVLEGSNIAGKKEFHGGIDLVPGQNTVALVASGSGDPEDILVQAAFLSVKDFSTMQKISAAIFANLKATADSLSVADRLSYDKVFASYKTKIAGVKTFAVAAGESHSIVLRDDGTLAAFGSNVYGQLGKQGSSIEMERKFVPFHSMVNQVAAGADFSLMLTSNGKVFACGNNDSGQLGIAAVSLSAYPLEVSSLPAISKISAGGFHAFAIDGSGNLYAWGKNSDGQLGAGAISTSETPRLVATNVKEAAAGNNFSLIVKNDGTVWGAGDNRFAQMAANIGDNSPSFVQIPGITDASSISAGFSHCLALKTVGTVMAWGSNLSGQAGTGSTQLVLETPTIVSGLSGIVQVEAGNSHSIARNSAGTIFGFGDNSSGQLAISSVAASSIPVQLTNPTSVTILAVGGNHNIAESTSTFTWGANNAGQLGNGQTSETAGAVPVERALTW